MIRSHTTFCKTTHAAVGNYTRTQYYESPGADDWFRPLRLSVVNPQTQEKGSFRWVLKWKKKGGGDCCLMTARGPARPEVNESFMSKVPNIT